MRHARVGFGRAVRARPRTRALAAGPGLRLFVLSAGALATAFLLALLYLRFATGIAASGYELQALEARRAELEREHELLAVELRRVSSPPRIEAEAQRLGLAKAVRVFVIDTGTIVAGSR